MNTHGLDLLEVVLKRDLEIPLNEEEIEFLNKIDEDAIEAAHLLLGNIAFLDDIKNIIDKIVKNASNFPIEQQEFIKSKCQKRIRELEFSTLTLKNIDITDKNLKKC